MHWSSFIALTHGNQSVTSQTVFQKTLLWWNEIYCEEMKRYCDEIKQYCDEMKQYWLKSEWMIWIRCSEAKSFDICQCSGLSRSFQKILMGGFWNPSFEWQETARETVASSGKPGFEQNTGWSSLMAAAFPIVHRFTALMKRTFLVDKCGASYLLFWKFYFVLSYMNKDNIGEMMPPSYKATRRIVKKQILNDRCA